MRSPVFLNVKTVAQVYGCTRQAVHDAIQRRRLRVRLRFRPDGRAILHYEIPLSDVLRYAERNRRIDRVIERLTQLAQGNPTFLTRLKNTIREVQNDQESS